MLKVVETFAGIGAQAKALKNIGFDFEVVNTVEWDINAIYAYDIIHNGAQDLSKYDNYSKDDLIDILSKYQLSPNGKVPMEKKNLNRMNLDALKRIYAAIERTRNLVSITDVKHTDLPDDIDLLTYSFPCQDLSISGFWHGNKSGIDREANNRSSMLWQIERILMEFVEVGKPLPKFLLMENVTNIHSDRHMPNFQMWMNYLESIGYENKMYDLLASNFGVPQNRKRTFLLSVYCEDDQKREKVRQYLEDNDLMHIRKPMKSLSNYLRLDYSVEDYLKEAISSIPNDTKSRRAIREKNPMIVDESGRISKTFVRTITTKQDRHPNSGIISHPFDVDEISDKKKSNYRYLTPRECFMLMGFDEKDYQCLIDNNFTSKANSDFLTMEKLIKMAGNSIVVDVLEAIFEQVRQIIKNT